MTITGLYTQNLTLNFNASSSSSSPLLTPVITNQRTDAATPTATTTPAPGTDTVSISAEAIRMQTVVVTVSLAPAPSAAPAQAGPAEAPQVGNTEPARGDALFEALDADDDGTVTREEFVDGSRELLQNARRHGRSHGHHREGRIEDGERRERESSRLTRRLERLFDRIDANEDGSVAKAELAGALERNRPTRAVTQPSITIEQPAPVAASVAEPLSVGRGQLVDSTSAEAARAAEAVTATAAPATTNGQRQAAANEAPPVGSLVTMTQITITIAIQQYTAVSGSTEPSSTLRAAA